MSEQEIREKVIKGLECCVNDLGECELCPYDEGMGKLACGKNLYSDALTLLKAQEPVEPKPYDGFSYLCGKCERVISGKYSNCPWCGQAVKWDARNSTM